MKNPALFSIKPYYAYLIMKGIKTLEVRKTLLSKDNWTGEVYAYVSKDKKSLRRIPEADRAEFSKLMGKVPFQFQKGGIMCEAALYTRHGMKDSCLTPDELSAYAQGKELYGYRVADLKVYERPRELCEFATPYKRLVGCANCAEYDCTRCSKKGGINITRAPQSYMYAVRW